ncbi:unnamed protein product [Pylaiella littoralis]
MIPLLAAILLAGAAGAGPVLVSDACGQDTTSASAGEGDSTTRCAVENIDRSMRAKSKPAELKVEAEGKLYSVAQDVKYITPDSTADAENWWKEFIRKLRELCDGGSEKAKTVSLDPTTSETAEESSSICPGCSSDSENDGSDAKAAAVDKDVRSAGEHSCQICFEHDHSTVMLPCGHGGLCWDCGLQIYALTEECPMCRTKIEQLVQVDGKKRRYDGEDEYVSAIC